MKYRWSNFCLVKVSVKKHDDTSDNKSLESRLCETQRRT